MIINKYIDTKFSAVKCTHHLLGSTPEQFQVRTDAGLNADVETLQLKSCHSKCL